MNEIDYEQEHPRELIKCVLVGDTGVGKTRLICAQAVGVGIPAPQDTKQHLHFPTVFAIDQYHVSQEIRERANFRVDGVDVALRLWDTFGDHEFNRKFAYQNAHVVLLCFAINCPKTFKNVNAVWYSEIKKYCPRTPIILVGMQSDWRLYGKYTAVNTSSSLSKRMRECSLITPDMGRQVAKEIGATYYETSVVTMWGVQHVFENTIRTALITRRQTRFWSSHLKGVQKPQLQPPYLPKKPDAPSVSVPSSSYKENLKGLITSGMCVDVEFLVHGQTIKAHRAILCAAAPTFAALFSFKEDKIHSSFGTPQKIVLQDALVFGKPGSLPRGFVSIDSYKNAWTSEDHTSTIQVKVDNFVSYRTFMFILEFLYSGNIPLEACTEELEDAARNLQLVNLADYVANVMNNTEYMNTEVHSRMVRGMTSRAKELVNSQMFSDIVFQIEGTIVVAHKAFLVAQCEMMAAMFMAGHFKESGVQMVEFKDTNFDAFLKVLEYLYTGQCPCLTVDDIIGVMALANFFCLPKLVALCEQLIVKELQVAMATDEMAVAEDIIGYLLDAQIHNATQLEAWCIHFIATHYNAVCRQCPKHVKNLDSATLKSIEKKRWPPPWYILEADWYEKATKELDEEKAAEKLRKSHKHIRHKRKCSCL
ncbi:hypothetical protein ACROYT_G006253 [Oculina patagonica]